MSLRNDRSLSNAKTCPRGDGHMEEINSLILYGCKLVRDLESNLQNIIEQPNNALNSCDEIAKVFTAARDRLNSGLYEGPIMAKNGVEGVPERLRYNASAMQALGQLTCGVGSELMSDVGDSSRGESMPRPRRRKDYLNRRTIRVPAPRMGNTQIPPEDGHTWRKYGQKEILDSRFSRSYYRCTHRKIYQCPAKKQVKRLDDDPFTFEISYRSDHTYHISFTARSIHNEMLPIQQPTPQSLPAVPLYPFPEWSLIDLNRDGETSRTIYEGVGYGASNKEMTGLGLSTVQFGPETDSHVHVADLAHAMFDIGTVGNDSMDFIFSSNNGENWE